ncbi:MAG: hypothetical protein IMF09_11990, partial [Proteobacteria bacterium]|nr:hypothetical protein [Pseudomonadota bacterium]
MKTKGQLLIAASILLVAIYLVFINPDKELKTPVLADPTITTTKEEASISVDKKQLVLELKNQLITDQIEFTENEKTHRSFNNVSNAKQAQSIIDETYAAGEDELAQQLERDLFGRCANPDYYSSVQKKNVEWLQESSHKYCDSYTTTMSFDENTERSLSITNLLVKKINSSEALIKKTDNSEKMKAVSDLINQATSRPELAEISLLWYRVLQSNPSASLSQLQYPYVSSNDYFSDIYIAS